MRLAHSAQLELGAVPIENIHTGAKSRDDIPAILLGLRHLCASKALRRRVFELLEAEVAPAARKDAGRPGMDLWRILALACPSRGSAATSTGWRTWPIMTGWCAGCRGTRRRSGMPASSRRRSTTSRFRVRSCCPGSGGWWPGRATRRPEKSLASRCAGGPVRSAWRPMCTIRPMRTCCGTRCAARCAPRPGWRTAPGLTAGDSMSIYRGRSRSGSTGCACRGAAASILGGSSGICR